MPLNIISYKKAIWKGIEGHLKGIVQKLDDSHQDQSFFLQTLFFTAFFVTVLKILTYALVSTWSLVSSGWQHVRRKMHPWVLHGIAWYCIVLHGNAWYCMVLHALSRTILHYLALSCTILHIKYTCSQQMSPVIAFDIAVVAQKVKVQCCYRGPVWSEKVGGGSLVGRDGYQTHKKRKLSG